MELEDFALYSWTIGTTTIGHWLHSIWNAGTGILFLGSSSCCVVDVGCGCGGVVGFGVAVEDEQNMKRNVCQDCVVLLWSCRGSDERRKCLVFLVYTTNFIQWEWTIKDQNKWHLLMKSVQRLISIRSFKTVLNFYLAFNLP